MIPYVLFTNAMGEDFADRLLRYAVEHRDIGEEGRIRDAATPAGRIDRANRNVLVLPLLGELRAELEAGVEGRLADVRAKLGIPLFERGPTQVSMVAYADGAFYRKHLDTTLKPRPGQATRQITFVYYFHREPKAFSSGALRLYDPLRRESLDLEPRRDAFVAFPSWTAHEVLPVACRGAFADGRFAVNVWVTGRPIHPRP